MCNERLQGFLQNAGIIKSEPTYDQRDISRWLTHKYMTGQIKVDTYSRLFHRFCSIDLRSLSFKLGMPRRPGK